MEWVEWAEWAGLHSVATVVTEGAGLWVELIPRVEMVVWVEVAGMEYHEVGMVDVLEEPAPPGVVLPEDKEAWEVLAEMAV